MDSFFFIVDEGREDPSTTISGPLLARQRNTINGVLPRCADDDPTLNAGFVCNSSGDPDLYCWKTLYFGGFPEGGGDPCMYAFLQSD